MKKLASILLLVIFCVYSFTYKVHYCYNQDGSRFHGDCTKNVPAADLLNLQPSTFQQQEFNCRIIQLEKQYQQAHYFNTIGLDAFILPETIQLPLIVLLSDCQTIPIFSCRGGPPLKTISLRGPPLV